jgi:hypothetical protein
MNATSQTPRNTRTSKPKASRREIIKIRDKINEMETKKTIQSMKQNAGSLKKKK